MCPRTNKSTGECVGARGVSLLELIFVLGILAVLVLIASPSFRDTLSRYRLDAATSEMSELIRKGRVLAVTRGTRVRIAFVELDRRYLDRSQVGGVARLEVWDSASGGKWTSTDGHTLPADNTCFNNGAPVADCLDLKERYRSISLAWVDPEGLLLDTPTVDFAPDGFASNASSDFLIGLDPGTIEVILVSKRSSGRFEARVLHIDRAGWVLVDIARG